MDTIFSLIILVIFTGTLFGLFIGIYRSIKRKNWIKSIIFIFVFAFIILSTWLGINMHESYDANEKIYATQANHSNTKSYIDASFTKCSAGSTTITLGTSSVACSSGSIANSFATYLNSVNKNPYSTSTAAIAVSSNNTPALGVSHINYSDNTMTIITNVGDDNGGNTYIKQTIIWLNHSE
jgi:hypothetical protein